MEANELRIGNLILKDGEEIIVSSYTFYNVEKDEDSYEPIPLTEKRLLEFGFTDNKDISNCDLWDEWTLDGFTILQIDNSTWILDRYEDRVEIKYVHKLQNLFFELTGKELEIKQA